MKQPKGADTAKYARFVAISAGTSGIILGAAAGSLSVLALSQWPLGLLVAYLAFRVAIALRASPQLIRLRRWWSMPLLALPAGVAAGLAPIAVAPFVLGAAIASYIVWFILYAIADVRLDPRGEHGAGWL